jgi:hypothetical protein
MPRGVVIGQQLDQLGDLVVGGAEERHRGEGAVDGPGEVQDQIVTAVQVCPLVRQDGRQLTGPSRSSAPVLTTTQRRRPGMQ